MTGQLSVVIPARNDAAGLPNAVESVLAQQGVDVVEVFLCVGPSTDDTADVAQRLADQNAAVHFLANPDGGISAGLNIGLAAVTTDVLVRVDARCRLPQGYVATACSSMADTGAANIGAVQVPVGHAPVQRAIALAMAHRIGSGGAAYRQGDQRRKVATAFLGVYAVDALRSIGGWDERFARNEDAELNHRLAKAGGEVWLEPRLRVDYEPRATLRGLARQYFDYGWWRRRMIARHRVVQLRQLAAPAILVGSVVGLGLGLLVTPWFLVIPLAYGGLLVAAAATLGSSTPGSTVPGSSTPASTAPASSTPGSTAPGSAAPGSAAPGSSTTRIELSLGDRIRAAAAMAVMHLSWGAGFLSSTLALAVRSDQWRN